MVERLLTALAAVPFVVGAAVTPAERAEVVLTFEDEAIVESSGLVLQDGLVLTANDSGDSGRVFAVDPRTGETVGVTTWTDDATDVEGLAPAGPGSVWVGDIGDNPESRDTIQVAQVPVGRGEREVDPVVYDLAYPDGAHDAETLLADPATGRLYVATKGIFGGTLYAAPERLDPDRTNPMTSLGPTMALATDGTFFPDGRHLVLRSYGAAAVYTFPSLDRLGAFDLPSQPQGEGITLDGQGRLLLSTEGLHSHVLRVSLPADLRDAVLGSSMSDASAPAGEEPPASAGDELPATEQTQRDPWPWLLSGAVLVAILVVLLRSLRPR